MGGMRVVGNLVYVDIDNSTDASVFKEMRFH